TPTIDADFAPKNDPFLSHPMIVYTGAKSDHFTDSIPPENMGQRRFRRIFALSQVAVGRAQRSVPDTQQDFTRCRRRVCYFRQPHFLDTVELIDDPRFHYVTFLLGHLEGIGEFEMQDSSNFKIFPNVPLRCSSVSLDQTLRPRV